MLSRVEFAKIAQVTTPTLAGCSFRRVAGIDSLDRLLKAQCHRKSILVGFLFLYLNDTTMMIRAASHHMSGFKRRAAQLVRQSMASDPEILAHSAVARRRPWLLIPNCSWSSTLSDGRDPIDYLHVNRQPELALALAYEYDSEDDDYDSQHHIETTMTAAGSRPPPTNLSSRPYPPPSSSESESQPSSRKSGGGTGGGRPRCKLQKES